MFRSQAYLSHLTGGRKAHLSQSLHDPVGFGNAFASANGLAVSKAVAGSDYEGVVTDLLVHWNLSVVLSAGGLGLGDPSLTGGDVGSATPFSAHGLTGVRLFADFENNVGDVSGLSLCQPV